MTFRDLNAPFNSFCASSFIAGSGNSEKGEWREKMEGEKMEGGEMEGEDELARAKASQGKKAGIFLI